MQHGEDVMLMKKFDILLVEDGKDQREMLRDFLISEGCEVTEAGNGETAIKAFLKGHFDLIILDYKMPGMDGLQVLKEIKRVNPKAKVIMVTAYGTIETAVAAMKSGAIDYITKPIDLDELLILVNNVAKRSKLRRQKRDYMDKG